MAKAVPLIYDDTQREAVSAASSMEQCNCDVTFGCSQAHTATVLLGRTTVPGALNFSATMMYLHGIDKVILRHCSKDSLTVSTNVT
jgi:hypothetical protein